jgi:hypothetical protein
MWLAGNVAFIGEIRDMSTGFSGGKLKEIDHLEDLIMYGRITLKYILQNLEWGSMD